MQSPEFIMLVGLPASGKSTKAQQLQKQGYTVYSSDMLRGELYGSAEIQGDPHKIFSILQQRIRKALLNGSNVILDATNLNRKKRMGFLKQLPEHITTTCMVFTTPIYWCRQRDLYRDRTVGIEVIEKMARQFECPGYYEGWDHIEIIPHDYHVSLPKDLSTFTQDNSHHTATLGDHMDLTVLHLDDPVLKLAGQYHDIGKYYTKAFFDSHGNPSKEAHYYGHENYGAYVMLSYWCQEASKRLPEDEDVQALKLYIIQLINWHMRPYLAWKHSEKARLRDRELLGEQFYNDLLALHEADKAAH